MIVHLPADRDVVVDAKVSLSAYLEALEAETEDAAPGRSYGATRSRSRTHMMRLSQKAYWDQFERAPEFVVMFIPGESFFSAAVEQEHELLEDGMSRARGAGHADDADRPALGGGLRVATAAACRECAGDQPAGQGHLRPDGQAGRST